MRFIVIGAGVLGSLYAGRLAVSGQDVTLLARGARLAELRRAPLRLVDEAANTSITVQMPVVASIDPADEFDIGVVMVRADQVAELLPQLAASRGVKSFVFMHNRAAGSAALAAAVGPERVLLGFPGASGRRAGNTVYYRLIPEQATTLGSLNATPSQPLRDCAAAFEQAGFKITFSHRMEDWLKTHAIFVTAIAGAIYQADGIALRLSKRPDVLRLMVQGIKEGFRGLTAQTIAIEPRKLAVLFAFPSVIPQLYWRRYLARPAAELFFAEHARAAPGEMLALIEELRAVLPPNPTERPNLEILWGAVASAARRSE
jgi:2-dehydropantoate 2-reductase